MNVFAHIGLHKVFLGLGLSLVVFGSFWQALEAPLDIPRPILEYLNNDVTDSYPNLRPQSGVKKPSNRPIEERKPVKDIYATLWLHQVHRWFGGEDQRLSRIREFLQEAKNSGITSIMGDLPWEWTEREKQGELDLVKFDKGWMKLVCEMDLNLHVVITMRDMPPWLQNSATHSGQSNLTEVGKCTSAPNPVTTSSPSSAHPLVWDSMQSYTRMASHLLLQEYGTCIHSISPTMNNEFETRYSSTHNALRDYSVFMTEQYKDWQRQRHLQGPNSTTQITTKQHGQPVLNCMGTCTSIVDSQTWNWLGFREEFLAKRYERLCELVHDGASQTNHAGSCLLHFGEMFSTLDVIHSNLFFYLAKSPQVNHLVMDSNMALMGAPSSPSIVGVLVSTASNYNKTVHYEAATERIMACDDHGKLIQENLILEASSKAFWEKGSPLLLKSGVQYALDAGADSIGITNLCTPKLAGNLFASLLANTSKESETHSTMKIQASIFRPTAVIFVPYRAFYGWKAVVSGSKETDCITSPTSCWHPTLSEETKFGHALLLAPGEGECPVDVAQSALTRLWDDLRTRHKNVAIVGDVDLLTIEFLSGTSERVLAKFPCLMDEKQWDFFEGDKLRKELLERTQEYPFKEWLLTDELRCHPSSS